jgi:hypothetical protein
MTSGPCIDEHRSPGLGMVRGSYPLHAATNQADGRMVCDHWESADGCPVSNSQSATAFALSVVTMPA